jgi:PAS domain S-box-containing protein
VPSRLTGLRCWSCWLHKPQFRWRTRPSSDLQRSEAYLAQGQSISHTGSYGWNVSSGEIYWSEETYHIYGLDRAVKITRELAFQLIHPDDRDRLQQILERAPIERSDIDFAYRSLMPDGSVKYLHSLSRALETSSGGLEYVGAVTDVTERTLAEEALRQAKADLAHINRVTTVGELTVSMAHEVKQPIAAAVTDANTCMRWLTRDCPDLLEARAAAMRVVKDATRASEIISRIRLLFNKGTSERELVNVNEVIGEMIVLMRSEAIRYNIAVRKEPAADLPRVMGDRVQLQQVLMNLMVNAIDAMKDVDGARELVIRSQRAENEQLLVTVSDIVVGLPPQQEHQIFDAFFTTMTHRSGMGLRISRSIVESHGGRLWAAANSPRGANFYFTLPGNAQVPQ